MRCKKRIMMPPKEYLKFRAYISKFLIQRIIETIIKTQPTILGRFLEDPYIAVLLKGQSAQIFKEELSGISKLRSKIKKLHRELTIQKR
jgi:N-acetylglucosamine-6-phosphate deacetylase